MPPPARKLADRRLAPDCPILPSGKWQVDRLPARWRPQRPPPQHHRRLARSSHFGHQRRMNMRIKALLVHLLTATGSILSMLAMLAAVQGKWSMMFLWLVVALIVDGVDGPLARRYDTKKNWPLYDGILMDLIVDYLTYVFIPAYALFKSGLLPGWTGWLAIFAIIYGSVIYFSDTRMKTKDKSFSGFPACWNMVVLVLFAIQPPQAVVLVTVIALTVAMFLNLKFVHPTRTRRWHRLNLGMAIVWLICAAQAAWVDFDEEIIVHWGLVLSSLYLCFAGIAQQIVPEKSSDRIA
jgi:phosphatidylcholine synthase